MKYKNYHWCSALLSKLLHIRTLRVQRNVIRCVLRQFFAIVVTTQNWVTGLFLIPSFGQTLSSRVFIFYLFIFFKVV